jgi:hypothetical protein
MVVGDEVASAWLVMADSLALVRDRPLGLPGLPRGRRWRVPVDAVPVHPVHGVRARLVQLEKQRQHVPYHGAERLAVAVALPLRHNTFHPDNAAAESFFASLKNECYHLHRHATRARARFTVAEYIEVFYNRKVRHEALDVRVEVRDLRRPVVAATGLKLGAA